MCGALSKVKLAIETYMPGFGVSGFCSTFGILIASLWEESATPDPSTPTTTDFDQQAVSSKYQHGSEVEAKLIEPSIYRLSTNRIDPYNLAERGNDDVHQLQGSNLLKDNVNERITSDNIRKSLSPPTSQPSSTSSPSPSSMSLSLKLPLQTSYRRKSNWHPMEDEYLRYLMEQDLTWS
jgi:hypothetical protein